MCWIIKPHSTDIRSLLFELKNTEETSTNSDCNNENISIETNEQNVILTTLREFSERKFSNPNKKCK